MSVPNVRHLSHRASETSIQGGQGHDRTKDSAPSEQRLLTALRLQYAAYVETAIAEEAHGTELLKTSLSLPRVAL